MANNGRGSRCIRSSSDFIEEMDDMKKDAVSQFDPLEVRIPLKQQVEIQGTIQGLGRENTGDIHIDDMTYDEHARIHQGHKLVESTTAKPRSNIYSGRSVLKGSAHLHQGNDYSTIELRKFQAELLQKSMDKATAHRQADEIDLARRKEAMEFWMKYPDQDLDQIMTGFGVTRSVSTNNEPGPEIRNEFQPRAAGAFYVKEPLGRTRELKSVGHRHVPGSETPHKYISQIQDLRLKG